MLSHERVLEVEMSDVLTKPASSEKAERPAEDATWQEKLKIAQEARAAGQKMREQQPPSFRGRRLRSS